MSVELQIALWGVGAFCTVIGGGWGLVKAFGHLAARLLAEFNARLDERFTALEKAREEGQKIWAQRLLKIEEKQGLLEQDVRRILIELPREYMARTDYIRRETIIEAKIDQLGLRWENWILKKEALA